jgi:hypothetical protein
MTCREELQKLLDCARLVSKGAKITCDGKSTWILDQETLEEVEGRLILIDEKTYQELRKELDSQKTFAEMAMAKADQ